MFILEAGKNHLGRIDKADKLLNFFLKSNFKKLTFMCQTNKWYQAKKEHFKLPISFYQKALKLANKKNKSIGLSVCDLKTYNDLKHLNFKFYKLLSIAINNYELIKELKKKNKTIYISTGYNASDKKIKNCLKKFRNYKKKVLLHTPMVKNYEELKLNKITTLKKKYKIDVGYSNHFYDINILNTLSAYNPKVIMLYIKPARSRRIKYPDDKHALFLDQLFKTKKNYYNCLKSQKFENEKI